MPPNSPPRRKLAKAKSPEKPSASSKPQDSGAKNAPDSPETRAEEKLTEFEKHIGISVASLKKIFEKEPSKDKNDPVVRLRELLRNRCVSMRDFSTRNWKIHAAESKAYGAAFEQITPTLTDMVFSRCNGGTTKQQLEQMLALFGIPDSSVFTTIHEADGKTIKDKIITRDRITTVKVPIVKSYVNARVASLYAERDVEPFMSFELTKSTEEWQVVGEILTKLASNMAAGFDYKAIFRGVTHQSQKHGCCMMFPAEVWYPEKDKDGKTVKEGIRYNFPPPDRVGYDQTFRPNMFNSDTGGKWAGYWKLCKWADVDLNPAYYNKDKVSYSATNWMDEGSAFRTYCEWMYPCTMEFPYCGMPKSKDREKEAEQYSNGDNDRAIFETQMFMRISPKHWGLGDYEPEVWFRWVLAGDGDILYCEPYPYTPPLYLGTDADDSISNVVPSFALECIPWYDLVSNCLTDIYTSMKQNNIKVIFYDKLQITEQQIEEMMAKAKQSGQALWLPMDWRDLLRGQVNIDLLFKAFTFPLQNIGEKIATLNTIFNVMERGLGISAQETGSIAGHIQTKAEVDAVTSHLGNRLGLQLSMGDDFIDAWKRQIVLGMKWFMDEDFAVEVSAQPKEVIDRMKKEFGFEFKSIGKDRMEVKGKKSKLSVDAFLSAREGRSRQVNAQAAQIILQALAAVSANQELAAKIGTKKIVDMYNRALVLLGAPEDERFQIDPDASDLVENEKVLAAIEELSKQMIEAAKQAGAEAAAKVTQDAGEQIAKQVAPAIQQTAEATAQAQQTAEQAAQGVQAVAQQSQQSDQQIVEGSQQTFATKEELEAFAAEVGQFMQRLQQMIAMAQQPPPPLGMV